MSWRSRIADKVFERWRRYGIRAKLELARQRVAPLRGQILAELPFEHIPNCSLCSPSSIPCGQTIIATRDRYGLPIRLALCHRTGILYLMDRLTPAGYQEFYRSGLYRRLIAQFLGKSEHDLVGRQDNAACAHATTFLDAVRGLIRSSLPIRMLDVGGSTGALAHAFVTDLGAEALVVDPAAEELRLATRRGLKTMCGFIEDLQFGQDDVFDVIAIHQTIEHLHDVRRTFEKVLTLLRPGGLVMFDILDFMSVARKNGCAEAVSRLDHCFFLYNEMLEIFCRSVVLVLRRRVFFRPFSILCICERAGADVVRTEGDLAILACARTILNQNVAWADLPTVPIQSRTERAARAIARVMTRRCNG